MQVWGWVCQKRQLDGEAPKTQGTALSLSSPACAKCTKAAGAAAGEAVPLRAVRAWPRCGRRAAAVRSPPPRAGSGARQVPGPAGGMERPPPRTPHGHRTGTARAPGRGGAGRVRDVTRPLQLFGTRRGLRGEGCAAALVPQTPSAEARISQKAV